MSEKVLCFPSGLLTELGYFCGFSRYLGIYNALMAEEYMAFLPREKAEKDPSWKQVIPYVVLRHRSGSRNRVFRYTRGKGQGESRLHLKRSIGIGGHINQTDGRTPSLYLNGLMRELAEEVRFEGMHGMELPIRGFINDDSTPVGRVHFGVVHVGDMESMNVQDARPKKLNGADMTWKDFRDEYTRLKIATMRDGENVEIRLDVCERIVKPKKLKGMATPENRAHLQRELLAGTARSPRPTSITSDNGRSNRPKGLPGSSPGRSRWRLLRSKKRRL